MREGVASRGKEPPVCTAKSGITITDILENKMIYAGQKKAASEEEKDLRSSVAGTFGFVEP